MIQIQVLAWFPSSEEKPQGVAQIPPCTNVICQAGDGALVHSCLCGIFVLSSACVPILLPSTITGFTHSKTSVMHVQHGFVCVQGRSRGQLGVRTWLGLPTCVFCSSPSTALSRASPECPCFPQWVSMSVRGHFPGRGGMVLQGVQFQRKRVPFAVDPGKPGSAQCQSCWPAWVLREKLSTKLLTVFSEVLWLCISIMFLHFCNLQCDPVPLLSLIPNGIINPVFNE